MVFALDTVREYIRQGHPFETDGCFTVIRFPIVRNAMVKQLPDATEQLFDDAPASDI